MGGCCESSKNQINSNGMRRNIIQQDHIKGTPEEIDNKKEIELNEKLKSSICKIYGNNKFGTGFLCKIQYPDQFNYLPVLITNKKIINKDELLDKKKMDITFDQDREEKNILISSNRKIFTSEKYDITIIEILPKDDEIKEFLEINEENNNIQEDSSICILQYANETSSAKPKGIIKKINNLDFEHTSSKIPGGPILLLDNLKVIGLNLGNGKGLFLEDPIEEFKSYTSMKSERPKVNCIECKYIINNGEEISLLHDYSKDNIQDIGLKSQYNEGKKKKKFIEENVKIIIDSQPINFNYKYKSNNNRIYVKYIFNQTLNDLSFMFLDCPNLESADFSSFDTTYITNMVFMFCGCTNLKWVNLSTLNSKYDINVENMFNTCKNLNSIEFPIKYRINISSISKLFLLCSSLETIDLSSFDTNKVRDMENVFTNCTNLKTIKGLASFNTSNVKSMRGMFSYCHNLKFIDVSHFDTRNVENMTKLFFDCRSLETLDLSPFDTKNVLKMDAMFMGCHSLKTVNLNSFNTINVKDMSDMFSGCESLLSLNLTKFNTINVKSMRAMFFGCRSLGKLDLSSFVTPNLIDIFFMFQGCLNLESLDLSSFNAQKAHSMGTDPFFAMFFKNIMKLGGVGSLGIDNIFIGCINLKNLKCKDQYILEMYKKAREKADHMKNLH